MKLSERAAEAIHSALKEAGINFVVNLPDSWMRQLIGRLRSDVEMSFVTVTREEEGVGVASGAFLGGRRPALVMESSGLGNSANALSSLNLVCKVPILIIASYRGGIGDNAYFSSGTRITEPLLTAIGVPHLVVRDRAEIREAVLSSQMTAQAQKVPVALLLCKSVLWEE